MKKYTVTVNRVERTPEEEAIHRERMAEIILRHKLEAMKAREG